MKTKNQPIVNISVFILLFVFLTSFFRGVVVAKQDEKVTICHRTDSVTNPYVQEKVDNDSVDMDTGNDNGKGDHAAQHQGPLASSQSVAQVLKDAHTEWGDIIPPHDNYGGLNWTTVGQVMYNSGCNYVTITPTATPTAVPTSTPTVTTTPTNTPTPTTGISNPTSTPTPTVTNTPTPTTSGGQNTGGTNINPTATATPGPTATQTPGPSATPTPGQSGSVAGVSTQHGIGGGEVLGASTLASTGTFSDTIANFALMIGFILGTLSIYPYAKKSE